MVKIRPDFDPAVIKRQHHARKERGDGQEAQNAARGDEHFQADQGQAQHQQDHSPNQWIHGSANLGKACAW